MMIKKENSGKSLQKESEGPHSGGNTPAGVSFLSNLNVLYLNYSANTAAQTDALMTIEMAFEGIFSPLTQNTLVRVCYSRKIRAMHRVLFVLGREETATGMPE